MFEEDTSPPKPPKPGLSVAAGVILAFAIAAVAGGVYWLYTQLQATSQQVAELQATTRSQAASLKVLGERLHLSAAELARLSSTASQVQQKVSQTQQQLASTQQQTQTLAQQQAQAANDIAAVKQQTGTQFGAINGQITGVKGDVKTTQKEVAETRAELEATKAQLKSTIGDLGVQSGLIATTAKQLKVLEQEGARAYFEFQLAKTKKPVRIGTSAIWLQVKKIDRKHEKYTIDVYADDTKVEKKDKTLNEPVQFLVGSDHALNELVVYQIDKKTITGYLSAPKYPNAIATKGGN
jgi:chromosome segregation ATPase